MMENKKGKIRRGGLKQSGNSRVKHLRFLGAAPAQRETPNATWAIRELRHCNLNLRSFASEIRRPALFMLGS